jgi:CheY-like chemotaxis protein
MHRKTILIADDQTHMLLLLQMSLASIGCRILTASSGEEVLIKAASTPIDLLLIDFEMLGLTGVQTAQQLTATPPYADLPIVLITGRGQKRIRAEATLAGVTLIVTKPFSPAELLETVRRLFSQPRTAAPV